MELNGHDFADDLAPAMGHWFKGGAGDFSSCNLVCNWTGCEITWNVQRNNPTACTGSQTLELENPVLEPGPAQDMYIYQTHLKINQDSDVLHKIHTIGELVGLSKVKSYQAVTRAKASIVRLRKQLASVGG